MVLTPAPPTSTAGVTAVATAINDRHPLTRYCHNIRRLEYNWDAKGRASSRHFAVYYYNQSGRAHMWKVIVNSYVLVMFWLHQKKIYDIYCTCQQYYSLWRRKNTLYFELWLSQIKSKFTVHSSIITWQSGWKCIFFIIIIKKIVMICIICRNKKYSQIPKHSSNITFLRMWPLQPKRKKYIRMHFQERPAGSFALFYPKFVFFFATYALFANR